MLYRLSGHYLANASRVPLFLGGAIALSLFVAPSAYAQTKLTPIKVEVPSVTQRSAVLGRVDAQKVVNFAISLSPANQAAFEAFAESVSDPKSPNYRKFITPKEVGARFGATDAQVQAVTSHLKKFGVNVTLVADNKLNILASGTIAQLESAFNTTFNNYKALSPTEPGNTTYFSYSKPLQLPTTVAKSVLDVSGLESFTKPRARGLLNPAQTRSIYNSAPLYAANFRGQGRKIGIANFDGYRLSNVPLYYTQFGLPTPAGGLGSNVTVVVCGTAAGTGDAQGEGDLDIQMALGTAPLSNLFIYDGIDEIAVLTQAANDNTCDIISESWGWVLSSGRATAAHNLHLSMTAQGITYMAATGDHGTTLEPFSYPNYEPEVLEVGGTVADVNGSGTRSKEVGWSGSGSGWSTNTAAFNTRPSWLKGSGVPSINFRLNPDLALHASGANPAGGAYPFFFGGTLDSGSLGTSFASPVFAGLLATAQQKAISVGKISADTNGKFRMGRIQNLIYGQAMRSDVWFDVVQGPSTGTLPDGSTATVKAGWDFATGLGVMNISAFVDSLPAPGSDTVLTPVSIGIYNGLGTGATGSVSSVAAQDGVSYSIGSVKSSVGSVAAAVASFQFPVSGSHVNTVTLTEIGSAGSLVTSFIYIKNVNTGEFELFNTATAGATNTTATITLANPQNYIDGSNKLTVLVRDVYPIRLKSLPFRLNIDKLSISTSLN